MPPHLKLGSGWLQAALHSISSLPFLRALGGTGAGIGGQGWCGAIAGNAEAPATLRGEEQPA